MLVFGDGLRVYLWDGDTGPTTMSVPGPNGTPVTSLGKLVSAAFAADGASVLFATKAVEPDDLDTMARFVLGDQTAIPIRLESETGTAFVEPVIAAGRDSRDFYVAGLTTGFPGARTSVVAISTDDAKSWSTLLFEDELEDGDGSVRDIHPAPDGALILRTRQRILLRDRLGVIRSELADVGTLVSSDAMCNDVACSVVISTFARRVGTGVVSLEGPSPSIWTWFNVSPFNPLICRWLGDGEALLGGVNTEAQIDGALLLTLNTRTGQLEPRSDGLPSVRIVVDTCDNLVMYSALRGLAVGNGKVFANMFLTSMDD